MKCIKTLYKKFLKRKETPIVKISDPNLNSFLIVHDLEPTYNTNSTSNAC